ncbi:MAG: holo-ACP synthase [Anaerolineae bacterium]|nr:holo-ACP synthase [Anaerolineae bacterium]
MILRVGVDMIEVARVMQAASRHGERFYQRFFTLAERAYCQDHPRRLAARVAAKEAVAKALGTGIGAIRWVEAEVVHDVQGRPLLHLHGGAAELAASLGLVQWELSLSHTERDALAFVVMTGPS